MIVDIGTVSFALASSCLLALLAAQLRIWGTGTSSFTLLFATVVTLFWCIAQFFQSFISVNWFFIIPVIETIKNISWFGVLLSLLGIRKLIQAKQEELTQLKSLLIVTSISLLIPSLLLVQLIFTGLFGRSIIFFPGLGGQLILAGFLLTSIVGMALLEQVMRNTRHHNRWHLKFLCLGLGVLFSYDIYMYSNAILFDRIQNTLWDLRGGIISIATPFIALGVIRTSKQPIQMNISRRLVFHSGVLVAAGFYLLLMASAGFYIQNYSGEFGLVLQVMFWVVSLSFLVILIFSGRLRSILKVYINRHLFSTKYDYRDEWMRISNTLSQPNSDADLPERAINALADIVDSPSGGLWLTSNGTHFDQVAHVEMGWVENSSMLRTDPLLTYLETSNQLLNLNELNEEQESLSLPEWITGVKRGWLIIPLSLHENLLGFVLLKESRVEFNLILEDRDLLIAAGQQTASYLAQMMASNALSETKQFSAFNQVSAFVVHDIKTLNSQLSMMVKNAEKHKGNPSFVEDMISTTDHAVNKLNVLLQHFKREEIENEGQAVATEFLNIVNQVIATQNKLLPRPVFDTQESSVFVLVNPEELKASITHILQNAQEATDDDGEITLSLKLENGYTKLSIKDNGVGMTPEFIHSRLFRPFESTKGLTGMGIGVFQSREFLRSYGGELEVSSKPGVGSEFILSLPLA